MKSRMAIMSMLVLGVLASGTGTSLAISGVSDSGSAGKAQYPAAVAPQTGGDKKPEVLGKEEVAKGNNVAGIRAGAGGVQATRQVSVQEDGDLPFTGLAAIPLILIGIGLLVSGAVLRRRLPDTA